MMGCGGTGLLIRVPVRVSPAGVCRAEGEGEQGRGGGAGYGQGAQCCDCSLRESQAQRQRQGRPPLTLAFRVPSWAWAPVELVLF